MRANFPEYRALPKTFWIASLAVVVNYQIDMRITVCGIEGIQAPLQGRV